MTDVPVGPVGAPAADAADMRAVRQVVADADRLQSDVEGFTALLADDVLIVNIAGRRVRGRDEFGALMRQALASSLAEVLTTTEIVEVWFIHPDVALASCIKRVVDQRGPSSSELPSAGRLSVTLVRRNDSWLVAAMQTTPIVT